MTYRNLARLGLTVCLLLIGGCSSPDDEKAENNERDPEPYMDMGVVDMPVQVRGELCQVKVSVGSNVLATVPDLTATDLTTGQSLTILDRSSPGNFYFDAPLGHDVEFAVVPNGSVAPVAPLTFQATVDQRCEALSKFEFFTPVGLTFEQFDDASASAESVARPFVDVAAGLLFTRSAQRWYAVETTTNPRFDIALLQTEGAFEDLPEDARFSSLSPDYILAEGADQVMVLVVASGGMPVLATRSMPTPLRDVQVSRSLALIHDADGVVWRLDLGTGAERSASWTQVVEEPQRSVSLSSNDIWMLDDAGVVRRTSGETQALSMVGTIPGNPARITVNEPGTRLLGWFGPACEMWADRCGVALYDASDASIIADPDDMPVAAEDVRAATRVGVDFVLVTDGQSGLELRHFEADRVIDGESLSGTIDTERSTILPQGLAIATDRRVTFARTSSSSPAFEDGRWRVLRRTDDYIELVAEPCTDSLECERVLWFKDFRGRATQPGSTLLLGRDLDITPVRTGDAFRSIDFVRDGEEAVTSRSITIDPLLVPMGSPCLPIIDTTVTIERFTSVAKGFHCVTWWN